MPLDITLQDLVIAYRKAKADSYFENGHLTALGFAEYEADLSNNLNALLQTLYRAEVNGKLEIEVGGYATILKSIEDADKNTVKQEEVVFYSDSKRHWNSQKNKKARFRIIGQHPIDFHIISSLWIDKFGHRLERAVSENSYGCRLKRKGQTSTAFVVNASDPDRFELGHFRPYISDYKRWQLNGVKKVSESLKAGKKIVAVTADIKKFYHRIDPTFLTSEDLLIRYGIKYSNAEMNLTRLFVDLLKEWSSKVSNESQFPDGLKYNGRCGVPVGLSASKVIANLLLIYLDQAIEQELQPIYYGRYVDDLFIVLEDNGKIDSSEAFWSHVSKRIEGIDLNFITEFDRSDDENGPVIKIPYSPESLIRFGKGKEKLFILEGSSGESFVKTLTESLEENSSEWRMLPDSESDLETLTQEMAKASSDSEEAVNSLRKADGISIQRLKFALQLRNFEATIHLLPKEIWKDSVASFQALARDFVLSPDKLAVYSKYHPRLIRLAVQSGEYQLVLDIFNTIEKAWRLLEEKLNDSASVGHLRRAEAYNNKLLVEAVYTSCDFLNERVPSKLKERVLEYSEIPQHKLNELRTRLFLSDLFAIPFKSIFINEDQDITNFFFDVTTYSLSSDLAEGTFDLDVASEFIQATEVTMPNNNVPNALFFCTRPFSLLELTIVYKVWCESGDNKDILERYVDLFKLRQLEIEVEEVRNSPKVEDLAKVILPDRSANLNRSFALTSFQTIDESWKAWVRDDKIEPDKSRYNRLFVLLNDIIKCRFEKGIQYVVFPELSLPRKILLYLAAKLKPKGISLISGVEYEKRPSDSLGITSIKGEVSNQLLYILCTVQSGFNEQVCIVQEKTEAAIHEERELFNVGGKVLTPKNNIKYLIEHGGFYFSGLICNDLLNIDHRKKLRGLVDALIIVEWNKDIETYDPIIKSTSNDLHCFVVQVNNRKYGDTRLRAPYKESYNRDKARVKGGEIDYFVITTLEVKELREFQRYHRSPDGPFKPVPTGYLMSDQRREGEI